MLTLLAPLAPGAQATKLFGELYFGIISAVLTLLILVISEIIPKTLGALHWRRLAAPCAAILSVVQRLMAPLVWLSQWITKLFSRRADEGSVSREEFAALAELGAAEGVFSMREAQVVRSLLHFGDMKVRDIMSPRTVMFCLNGELQVEEVLAQHQQLPYSRISDLSGSTRQYLRLCAQR